MSKKIKAILHTSFAAMLLILLSACANQIKPQTALQNSKTSPAPVIHAAAKPQHIALLLPTTGPLKPYGTAIRNGFFTAFYEQKKQQGYSPVITVYDTNGKNVDTVYKTAIAQGANFIVGPLDKPSVTMLANDRDVSVPVLALNKTDAPPVDSHFFEFALSPTDEARQAAIKAWQDNHHNALVLAPNNAWGQRVANAFSQEWTTKGGTVVGTQYYGGMTTLARNIREILQISTENREDRKLKNMLHEKIRYMPQRRQDFDAIFLAATPAMAQQVQPMLRFYFVNNIPIYATSEVYAAGQNNHDLNGIAFCDMPWVLSPTQMQPNYLRNIQENIQNIWPKNYNHLAKFYAMGVDAFDLSSNMNQLQNGMQGATGTLYLSSKQVISRQLLWAKFANGAPTIQ